jgi:MFS-type transporter involved in bile tolerance (Atg22 family)
MTETPDKHRSQALIWTLAGVLGQVGCLTVLIIAGAIIAGLWLDNQFQTRPFITLGLVIASIPVTLFLMVRIVLAMSERIESATSQALAGDQPKEEESEGGKHPRSQA